MIFIFRHISWVAIISSLIGSALMFAVGALKTFYAINSFFIADSNQSLGFTDMTTTYVIKSLDAFLIAFVLFIFAYGVYKLFINTTKLEDNVTLNWIDVSSISQLKKILAEVIIVIIFVKFLEIILLRLSSNNSSLLTWEVLILPISIVLLALGLRLLNLNQK